MAAAGPHHHVLVLLEDHVGVVIEVEHGDGVQLGGGAAWLGHVFGVHEMDLRRQEPCQRASSSRIKGTVPHKGNDRWTSERVHTSHAM